MINQREKAYRAQLKRCYKRREREQTTHQQIAGIFQDFYHRRNRKVNGNYRPGKAWMHRRIALIKSLQLPPTPNL